MIDTKNKALEKMLEEMNKKHTPSEDAIHNWLCDQEDEELLNGVLKEGRTIKGAMQHCMAEASKHRVGNAAMIDDPTVFSWVRRYFTDDSVPKNQNEIKAEVVSTETKKEKRKSRKPKKEKAERIDEGEQLSLLDFI